VIATINIIPFVDIVLVLLIIFMLTANVIAKANIMVNLPRAASGGDAVPTTINIILMENGDLFLNGKPITKEAFKVAVKKELDADPKVNAVIAADRPCKYDKVINVIDTLRL